MSKNPTKKQGPNIIEAAFCKISKDGVPYDIIPGRLAKYFITEYYYGKIRVIDNQVFLYSDGVFRLDEDCKRLKTDIMHLIPEDLLEASRIRRVLDLILMNKAITCTMDEMNQYDVEIINFKNGMLDTRSMKLMPHSEQYLSTNQIPYNYDDTLNYERTTADRFFRSLIPDDLDREMLYRYVGLCFGHDAKTQKFMIIVGLPGTGKSVALNFISNIVGKENISGISLQDLNGRFYPTVLFGKLLNVCADLPKTALTAVDEIKKITGEDQIMGEYKGGKIFFFRSYAKLLFSTNELPPMLDEKSEGFFRRMLCISVTKKGEYIPDLDKGLESSKEAFIARCISSLHEYYIQGRPQLDSPNSLNVVAQYYQECDSVRAFISSTDLFDLTGECKGSLLYDDYRSFCINDEMQPLTRKSFFRNLRGKGFTETMKKGYTYFSKPVGSSSLKISSLSSTQSSTQVDENGFLKLSDDMENPFPA